jgi:MerR family redox-sensitive transcriptional activator SoxR
LEEATLSIGDVAGRAGVRTSSIRYYESIGVLPEPERQSGQRRYGLDAVERLKVIDVAQQAGFSLSEIRELLESSDRGQVSEQLKALAERKLPEVDELIVRAQAMKAWLETATACNCSTLDVCGLFDQKQGGPDRAVAAAELTVLRAGASGRSSVSS